MISVAVRGYGVVIWRTSEDWKAYGRSDRLTATLSTRVQMALGAGEVRSADEAREALLTIAGAAILTDEDDLADDAPADHATIEADGVVDVESTEGSETTDASNGFIFEN
jgi:hypothetical protein